MANNIQITKDQHWTVSGVEQPSQDKALNTACALALGTPGQIVRAHAPVISVLYSGAAPPANKVTASFSVTKNLLVITLADASSSLNGTVVSVSIIWGDGTTGSVTPGGTASHTYASEGSYTVSATATDSLAATDTKTQAIVVAATAPVGGSPNFKYVRGLAVINPVYPAYLAQGGVYEEPTTGADIERITDVSKVTGTNMLLCVYSRYTPENADGTLWLPHGANSTSAWVQRVSDNVITRPVLDSGGKTLGENNELRWDYNNPNIVRYVKGMQFWQQDVTTGVNTLIRDFSSDFPAGNLLMNDVEGDSSHDSRYWCWMVKVTPSQGSFYEIAFVTYDLQTNTILGTMTFANWGLPQPDSSETGRMPVPNMVEVSPDGRFAVIHWNRCWTDGGSGFNVNLIGTHADGPHVYPLTLDHTQAVKVAVDATHSAWAQHATGKWMFVSQNNRNDWIEAVDPDDGSVIQMIYNGVLGWGPGFHFSCCDGAVGGVLLSTYSPTQTMVGDNQLMILPLVANCIPLRISPSYNKIESANAYRLEGSAAFSRDGRRIYWSGAWGNNSAHAIETYRIAMPEDWESHL